MSRKSSRRVDDQRERRFKAVDLFAGCGGLTSGLQAAGFDIVAAIEQDADAAETYRANNPAVVLYEQDIRAVAAAAVRRTLALPEGETLDLLAGCPPCQGFTRLTESSGRRDRRNGLVREFLRFVRVLRPKVCMLENVPGLLRSRKGKRYFREVENGLKKAGYRISYDVVELADYGVPQFRKRLVLIAARRKAIPIPAPTHHDPARVGKRGQQPWNTVRKAIEKLPRAPLRSTIRAGRAEPHYEWHYARNVASLVKRRLEHALKHGRRRSTLPKSLRLKCHERRPDGYFDVYGVLDWDRPSPTITSGCTNASKGCFGHPKEARPLTAVEAARLQTFLLSHKFKGSGLESVARQIGNALPRRFAKVVGKAIAKRLVADASKVKPKGTPKTRAA